MVRVLAIADEVDHSLVGERLTRMRPDLVVSAGDLPWDYIESVASAVEAPRCGVTTTLGYSNSGLSVTGSSRNTSSAAPATRSGDTMVGAWAARRRGSSPGSRRW